MKEEKNYLEVKSKQLPCESFDEKAKLLLFDEPTANMDTGTEQQVLAGLKKHLTNETMLIVTHRMAPLSLVDRIIVLDNGRVAVDGPRDLVIQKLQAKKQLKINASLYSKHSIVDYIDYLHNFFSHLVKSCCFR